MDVFQDRPVAWVAADLVRIDNGRLAEHWDVLQDEATKAESKTGLPILAITSLKPRTK